MTPRAPSLEASAASASLTLSSVYVRDPDGNLLEFMMYGREEGPDAG